MESSDVELISIPVNEYRQLLSYQNQPLSTVSPQQTPHTYQTRIQVNETEEQPNTYQTLELADRESEQRPYQCFNISGEPVNQALPHVDHTRTDLPVTRSNQGPNTNQANSLSQEPYYSEVLGAAAPDQGSNTEDKGTNNPCANEGKSKKGRKLRFGICCFGIIIVVIICLSVIPYILKAASAPTISSTTEASPTDASTTEASTTNDGPFSTEPTCPPDKFMCGDGLCIPKDWACDGVDDCANGTDEAEDFCATCPFQFPCSNGRCTDLANVCNGHNNCRDNSDEDQCAEPTCPPDQFMCGDGLCVPKDWACDGVDDCANGTDEAEDFCATCPFQFLCSNGRCTNLENVCNGVNNCRDNSDEDQICIGS